MRSFLILSAVKRWLQQDFEGSIRASRTDCLKGRVDSIIVTSTACLMMVKDALISSLSSTSFTHKSLPFKFFMNHSEWIRGVSTFQMICSDILEQDD